MLFLGSKHNDFNSSSKALCFESLWVEILQRMSLELILSLTFAPCTLINLFNHNYSLSYDLLTGMGIVGSSSNTERQNGPKRMLST